MQFLVSNQTKNDRLDTCRTCEHYVAQTQSCGTLILGKKVGNAQLCGCVMPIKTTLKYAECPLGKWQAQITKKDIAAVAEILRDVNHAVTTDQNKQLTALSNKIFGRNSQVSNCNSCVKKMVNELRELVKQSEHELYGS